MATYEELCLWKRDRLVSFLRERWLPTTGKVEQLRALVYGAIQFDAHKKPTASEENKQRAAQYQSLLTVKGQVLPDPLTVLDSGWVGEKQGMSLWPPCMYGDIASYLVDRSERDLRTRLLTDYKESKAFSYFDSKWLKEVYYHAISPDSKYCFLKSQCTPSMNIQHGPHRVWVCITKTTGQVVSAYCSCFAGLGSTCNHVAAVLFKLDYAWQNGYTNKACTSVPAQWTAPAKTSVEPKRISEMEWRKPQYSKKSTASVINPSSRQLFSPVAKKAREPSLEGLMGSLYVSCANACAFQYAVPTAAASYAIEDEVNVGNEVEVSTSPAIPVPLKQLAMEHNLVGDTSLLTTADVSILERNTQSQTDNPEWFKQRIGRITGSNAHSVLVKARKIWKGGDPGDMNNLVDYVMGRKTLNPNLRPLKYGREMEPIARDKYIQIMIEKGHINLSARPCGLFVDTKHIYMAASPDAVVKYDCCGEGLLEIKCPLQIAHSNPEDSPPAYLIREADKLSLKVNHQYHTQVLMQLSVTLFNWCDFFVYTKHGYFLQRIYKECFPELINELQRAAKTIFTSYILPELTTTELDGEDPQPSTTIGATTLPINVAADDQPLQNPQLTTCVPDSAAQGTPPKKKRRKQPKVKKTAGPV